MPVTSQRGLPTPVDFSRCSEADIKAANTRATAPGGGVVVGRTTDPEITHLGVKAMTPDTVAVPFYSIQYFILTQTKKTTFDSISCFLKLLIIMIIICL